jgi:methyl-accepting chemotaxis protein
MKGVSSDAHPFFYAYLMRKFRVKIFLQVPKYQTPIPDLSKASSMFKNILSAVMASVVLAVFVANFLSYGVFDLHGMTGLLISLAFAALIAGAVGWMFALRAGKPLEKLAEDIAHMAEGTADFSAGLTSTGDGFAGALAKNIHRVVERFADTVQGFSKTTHELSFAASRMSEVTERTETNTAQQQHETDQVATAMNEMSATVEEVARNTSEASAGAFEAKQAAEKGFEVATQTQRGIEQLVGNIENAAAVVNRLEKESEGIGVVLDVIKGIAEQTNLLALNAAIEAARAGEQGRGFAVVADEVRTLASRTQESTHEIENMIERLRTGARESVTVMGAARERGQSGAEQVANTLAALTEISAAVNKINDMNTQIATAAEEQSQVANEINRNVVNISRVAELTTQDARDARTTSEQLADLSNQLMQLVRKAGMASGSLDLSSAKAAHLNWKTRLRSYLDGKSTLTREQAVSHRHCDFGKWYYSEGLRQFGHLKPLKDVEDPHEQLHELIRMIIDVKKNGQNAEAERLYKNVASLSEKIVGLLNEAEVQAGRPHHHHHHH